MCFFSFVLLRIWALESKQVMWGAGWLGWLLQGVLMGSSLHRGGGRTSEHTSWVGPFTHLSGLDVERVLIWATWWGSLEPLLGLLAGLQLPETLSH